MRKLLSFFFSTLQGGVRRGLLFLALLATTTLWAYDFQSGDLYYNITSSSAPYTVEVTYKTKGYTSGDASYPEFNFDWYIDSISVPKSVTYNGKTYTVTRLGDCAFADCDSLKYVFIPESVVSVGGGVFYGCNSLRNIILSPNITQYPCFHHRPSNSLWRDYGFFENCSSLTELTISNNVTHIDYRAFFGCSSLIDITIPNSVIEIGGGAFKGCSSLKNIVLSENITDLTYISENLGQTYGFFEGCSSLISITIPDGVKTIGLKTFAGCSSLTSITLPNSVTTVGGGIFYNCSSLKNIVLSENITSLPTSWIYRYGRVGIGFFEGCSSLTSVIIPKNIKKIGYLAFYGCKNLVSLQVEDGNTTYDSRDNCNAIIETATNSLVVGCPNTTFPQSVTHIADLAFAGNYSLSEITIPNTITSMGGGVFYNCTSLQKIVLSENITSLSECEIVEELTYPSYSHSYVYDFGFFENCSSLDSIIIPNNVIDIGDLAFAGCSSLTNIIIPNSVTNIGGGVFYNCKSLKDIILSNSVSSINDAFDNYGYSLGVSRGFFENCTSLNEITLPLSIKSIDEEAFAGCTKLYDIYCFAMEPPTAYKSSFANYNAFLHVPCDNQRVYLLDVIFGKFKYIECIEAETTPTDTVVVTPSFNDAEFIWPSNSSADRYTLAISKDGEVFCTLTFNANGQLLNIAFAPGRNGNHPVQYAEQAGNGYRFTVTGLTEATRYAYDITTKDASNQTLATYSGEFTTMAGTTTTDMDNIHSPITNCQKIIRNGQLLILRDGVEYTIMGQEL